MGEGQGNSQKEFVARIGTFLLVLGMFGIILFLASDFADEPKFDWFFISLILGAIGYLFRRRTATPPPPNNRFSFIRKIRNKSKERKEKKAKKT